MTRARTGFTLLELVLVMLIILIASALAVPAIDALMADGRVKAARDMVRARWADIRGRAMQEGRPYKFSIMDQTGKFKIEPEDITAASDTDDPPLIFEGELPPEVLFSKDQSGVGAGGGGASGAPASASDYETLVVYLADGTARDDVQVMFGKAGVKPLGLKLRALTGAVTMIDQQPQAQDNSQP